VAGSGSRGELSFAASGVLDSVGWLSFAGSAICGLEDAVVVVAVVSFSTPMMDCPPSASADPGCAAGASLVPCVGVPAAASGREQGSGRRQTQLSAIRPLRLSAAVLAMVGMLVRRHLSDFNRPLACYRPRIVRRLRLIEKGSGRCDAALVSLTKTSTVPRRIGSP
jgi:hypothetical protein